MAPKAGQKHKRSDSETHDDYIQVEHALKKPTTQRAKEIDAHPPYHELNELLEKQDKVEKAGTILHWFRSKDLRQEDNLGLHAAAQKAKELKSNLVTMYLYSPKDLEWHGTSPPRSDFIIEGLRILKDQLEKKNIPLAIVTAETRGTKTSKMQEFIKEYDISHIYANYEYEVDELRRDIDLITKLDNVEFNLYHDQVVVPPLTMATGSGGPHKVFTRYYEAWLPETKDEKYLETVPAPEGNDKAAAKKFKALFESKIPELPESKQIYSKEVQKRLRKLWPPGNEAGMRRLDQFLKKKISDYDVNRSNASLDPSSRMSAYFSSGMVSVREVLAKTKKEANGGQHFDKGDSGVVAWVREIVFREFYRQITCIVPHGNTNLPQNLKFDNVKWSDDDEGWKKWCEGKTGVPFVDAGMRQLNHEFYMHNRLRMNTSSYLRGNMLIDYRKGERYFAEHLIDWDLSNNTQGWEPSYTFFNPVVQAEKHDPNGDFIRKWVPELKDLKGGRNGAIYAPHERLSKAEFEKLGYPRPHIDFAESAQKAKERYKQDLHSALP